MIVRLTQPEVRTGWAAAGERIIRGLFDPERAGYWESQTDDGRDRAGGLIGEARHARGCWSELAVAKALGKYWVDTEERDFDGDVGPGIQVRHSCHANGHLLLWPKDRPDHRFVLVTGEKPTELTIRGWVYGHEGKVEELWRAPHGRFAFWVPQARLHEFRPRASSAPAGSPHS